MILLLNAYDVYYCAGKRYLQYEKKAVNEIVHLYRLDELLFIVKFDYI